MAKYWIAVASGEHVRRGGVGGFMQVNHGKAAPLRRIAPGDGVAYYSPSEVMGGNDRLQSFTLIGTVREGDIYPGQMGDWVAFRRDVAWAEAHNAPIAPLLDRLEFTRGQKNWGYKLRFGLFEISAADFALIGEAMGADAALSAWPA